jgi:hypothetical protein
VLLTVPRNVRLLIALGLLCIFMGAVLACQVHTVPLDHEHTMPGHSHSSSAGHALLDFSCMGMAAVLPTIVFFAALLFHIVHATPLVLKHAVLAFPPFIPPRHLAR